jgi:hypothetical protein
MQTKRRKYITRTLFPPEIWVNVFEFLQTTKSFHSLYFLTKELHNYPWKNILTKHSFRMLEEIGPFECVDLSYVSTLNMCMYFSPGNCLRNPEIVNQELEFLKGIHSLDLYNCVKITDKTLKHLNTIHILNLSNCPEITDHGFNT